MDDTFKEEKNWKNVQGSRTKPKKILDKKRAEAFQAGFRSSPRQSFFDAIDIMVGKKKPAKKE